ncbi:MAG: GNAT family N-acetyltransferase [Saccharofermentanales bacterium]
MIIRDVRSGDLAAIAHINNYYRANTNHIWCRSYQSAEDMRQWLDEHSASPYCAIVAEEEGQIAGYASLSQFRPHSGYAPTAEDSIYVAPGYTGNGYGSMLMAALLDRARKNGLCVITAWIDSANTGSVRFHEKFKFRHIGRMDNVGVLDGQKTSVIIMMLDI